MKRSIALSVLTVLLGMLCVAPTLSAAETITLMVHWGSSTQLSELQRFAEEYSQAHPGIEIDIISTASTTSEMWERYLVMAAAGTPPDAVHFTADAVKEQEYMFHRFPSDFAAEVRDMYLPGAMSLAEYQGEILGYPTEFMSPAVVYNMDVFEQSGLGSAPTPASWDEFFGLAQRLTRTSWDGTVEQYGLTIDGGWREMYDIRSYLNASGFEVISSDGVPLLNSPQMIDAVSRWKEYIDSGIVTRAGATPLINDQAAMTIWEPWLRGTLVNARPEMYDAGRFGVSPVPYGSLGRPHVRTYGYLWAVPRTTKQVDETLRFLNWLNTSPTARNTTRMGDVMAMLGSLPSTILDWQNQEFVREEFIAGFIESLDSYVHVQFPDVPGVGMWDDTLRPWLAQIFSGSISVINGLERANADYAAAIARAIESRDEAMGSL